MLFPEENFSNVIGHQQTKKILNKFIDSKKIPSSIIFSGNEGIGKFILAKEFIKKLNNNSDQEINQDLKIIEPNERSLISVDDIRKINSFFSLSSSLGNYKSVIIRDADKMNLNASNSLLKVLEESTPKSIIILIYSHYNTVLDTIKSRCINLAFQNLSFEDFSKILETKSNEKLYKMSNGSISNALNLESLDLESKAKEFFTTTFDINRIKKLSDSLKEDKEFLNYFISFLFQELSSEKNILKYNQLVNVLFKLKNKNLDIYDYLKTIKYNLLKYN